MNIKKLPSGHELGLEEIPFGEAADTLRLISNELKLVDIDLGGNLKELMGKDLNSLKNALLQLTGSKAVHDQCFQLMLRCKYDGKAIQRTTFENMEARKDYLVVAKEVLLHTLSPFFEGLV